MRYIITEQMDHAEVQNDRELKIHFLKIKELMSGMKKFRHNIIIN